MLTKVDTGEFTGTSNTSSIKNGDEAFLLLKIVNCLGNLIKYIKHDHFSISVKENYF